MTSLPRTSALRLFGAILGLIVLCTSTTAVTAPRPPKKLDTKVEAPQVFRYIYEAGSTTVYDNKVEQELTMKSGAPGMPGGMTAKTSLDARLAAKTTKVLLNGSGVIVNSYQKLDMKITQGGREIPSEQLKPLIAELAKIKSTATISPRGEQTDVQIEGNPASAQVADSMKSALVGAAPVFPEKGLEVGEGWTQEIPLKMKQGPIALTLDFKVKYTFLGYTKVKKRRLAVFKSAIDMKVTSKPGDVPGQKIELGGSGSGIGFIYFDQKKGLVEKSEVEMSQDIDMRVSMEAQTQEMNMNMKTNATVTRKK